MLQPTLALAKAVKLEQIFGRAGCHLENVDQTLYGSVMAASDRITPFSGLLERDASKYDPRQFGWIGGIGKQINIRIAWHASPFQMVKDVMEKTSRASRG